LAIYRRHHIYQVVSGRGIFRRWFNVVAIWMALMTSEPPIAIELNCETGVETVRPLTAQEIAQREQDVARAEAERAEKDAKEATELAERTALATWIAGQSTLPEAARNALARATGVTLPALPT
jgi:hypothetical protein